MVCKFRFGLLLCVFVIFTVTLAAGCSEMHVSSIVESKNRVVGKELKKTNRKDRMRLEHVAINVEDPVRMAKWYCQNLGMKVIRKGPPPVNMHFISDAGGNMMLEIYHNPPDAVPDYIYGRRCEGHSRETDNCRCDARWRCIHNLERR